MAFWSGETLEERLPTLVRPFNADSVDCAAYTLHVGHEYYVSPDGQDPSPQHRTVQQLKDAEAFAIPPGQFAFLLTKESVTVPPDAIAFISIKAKLKFNGLIDISGFHVDPGYQGRLLFSVLNSGPNPIHLRQGQPVFLIWYADLDRMTERKKDRNGFESIDLSIVNGISGEILSLQSLSKEINDLRVKTTFLNKLIWIVVGIFGSILATLTLTELGPKILAALKNLFEAIR